VPSYRPRSSLPATVLAWLAAHLAYLTPPRRPGQGGTRPLSLEVRPAAVAGGPPGRGRRGAAGRAAVPACRPHGQDLQGRGRRQPGPAAWPAGRPGVLPAPRDLRHQPRRPTPLACGDGYHRRGGRGGRAGHPGAATPRVGQPEGAVRRQAPRPHRPRPCRLDHPRRPAAGAGGAGGGARRGRGRQPAGPGFPGLAKTRAHWHVPVGDRRTTDASATPSGPTTACRRGCGRWWSRRSPSWQAPGRCAAGVGCCTGSGTSSAPRAR
jgi:hypothetical protein